MTKTIKLCIPLCLFLLMGCGGDDFLQHSVTWADDGSGRVLRVVNNYPEECDLLGDSCGNTCDGTDFYIHQSVSDESGELVHQMDGCDLGQEYIASQNTIRASGVLLRLNADHTDVVDEVRIADGVLEDSELAPNIRQFELSPSGERLLTFSSGNFSGEECVPSGVVQATTACLEFQFYDTVSLAPLTEAFVASGFIGTIWWQDEDNVFNLSNSETTRLTFTGESLPDTTPQPPDCGLSGRGGDYDPLVGRISVDADGTLSVLNEFCAD